MTRLTPELVTELFCPTRYTNKLWKSQRQRSRGKNFRAKCLTKKHEKSWRFCVWMYGDSTLTSSKVLTGFFVGCKTFKTDCSSLEIFFKNRKTSRHKKANSLCSDVFRISKKISSEEQSVVKVLHPTKKPVKTLLLNVESPYIQIQNRQLFSCFFVKHFALKIFPRLRWRWDFHSLLV